MSVPAILAHPAKSLESRAPWYWVLARVWQTLTWWLGMLLLKRYCRIRIQGAENLANLEPGVIFVANHGSHLDGILLLTGVPPTSPHFPMYYVGMPARDYARTRFWHTAMYTPWFLTLIGALPLRRGTKNYGKALAEHIRLLQHNRSVAIFPEGGDFNAERPFTTVHGGAGFLAEATSAPIVPVWIQGTYDMTTESFFAHKHDITVVYGKPIKFSDVADMHDPDEIRYKNAVRRISEKVLSLRSAHA